MTSAILRVFADVLSLGVRGDGRNSTFLNSVGCCGRAERLGIVFVGIVKGVHLPAFAVFTRRSLEGSLFFGFLV